MFDGQVIYGPAPARLDCHYIISAWSPAQPGPAVEPALDEHSLLYKASAALINNAPIYLLRIYPAGSGALLNTPEINPRTPTCPCRCYPSTSSKQLAEFSGTMGMSHRWKPLLHHLVATLPARARDGYGRAHGHDDGGAFEHRQRDFARQMVEIGVDIRAGTRSTPRPRTG